jgi:hypothetical protein
VVSNRSFLTVINVTAAAPLTRVADYQAFQHPVMRVRWDHTRERLLATGMDQQLTKVSKDDEGALKVAYKIRVPQEITTMDVSADGKHFAVGLSNGRR